MYGGGLVHKPQARAAFSVREARAAFAVRDAVADASLHVPSACAGVGG